MISLMDSKKQSLQSQRQQQPTLICTVGLPYSGKEQWATSQGLPVVSLKACEQVLGIREQKQSKSPVTTTAFAKEIIQTLFHSGNEVVILLAENLTKKERAFWQAKANEYHTLFREFEVGERQALQAVTQAGASKTQIAQLKEMIKKYEALNLND